jgi:hypothetical protein
LANGKGRAIVDDEDYVQVSQHSWCLLSGKYAQANIKVDDKWKRVSMHRFVMNYTPADPRLDHKNRNGLDNRKSNLRPATGGGNQHNREAINKRNGKSTTSNYKGACWSPAIKRWIAQICIDSNNIYIGGFKTQRQAALHYDAAARQLHGEFACLNFPNGPFVELPPNWMNQKQKSPVRGQSTSLSGVRRRHLRWAAETSCPPFKYLGAFATETEAGVAWDLVAVWIDREKARVNFPERMPSYLAATTEPYSGNYKEELRNRLRQMVADELTAARESGWKPEELQ